MAEPLAVALYARISADLEGTGLGVARQLSECRALAAARGWQVVAEFEDNDVSAWSGKPRLAYERLLAGIREGQFRGVVVYHLDRLMRRPKELEEFVEVCQRAGVKTLATVTGQVDLGTGDGLLVARILAAAAANESDAKSRRLKSKHRQTAEAGLPHSGKRRPFGFEADRVTVNPVEAGLTVQAAERYIAGESLRSLAVWLQASGVPTIDGGAWRTGVIRQILTSPRMIGKRDYKGEIVADAVWPAILTETQQGQILARMGQRQATGTRAPRRYLLSGMLVCSKCGHRMASSPKGQVRRYVCKKGPDFGGCGSMTIVAAPVEEYVAEAVLHRLDTPELATLLSGRDDPDTAELRAQVAADEGQLEELAGMYADRQISAPEWVSARKPIEARIRNGRTRLAHAANASALVGLAGTGHQLRDSWATLNLDRQTAIITALVDHVAIGPGTKGRQVNLDRVQIVWSR